MSTFNVNLPYMFTCVSSYLRLKVANVNDLTGFALTVTLLLVPIIPILQSDNKININTQVVSCFYLRSFFCKFLNTMLKIPLLNIIASPCFAGRLFFVLFCFLKALSHNFPMKIYIYCTVISI